MEKVVLIRSYEFLIIISFISLLSCTRNDTVTLPTTTIAITVADANSWNISNNTMDVVNGATIRLYKSETDIMNDVATEYTAITGLAGKASLMVEYKREYF